MKFFKNEKWSVRALIESLLALGAVRFFGVFPTQRHFTVANIFQMARRRDAKQEYPAAAGAIICFPTTNQQFITSSELAQCTVSIFTLLKIRGSAGYLPHTFYDIYFITVHVFWYYKYGMRIRFFASKNSHNTHNNNQTENVIFFN